jgi:hypothetical protein
MEMKIEHLHNQALQGVVKIGFKRQPVNSKAINTA